MERSGRENDACRRTPSRGCDVAKRRCGRKGYPQWIAYDFGYGNDRNIQAVGIQGVPGYQWVQYAFPNPVQVAQILLGARPDGYSGMAPGVFSIVFADTPAGPWTTSFHWRGESGWAAGETRVMTDPNYRVITSAIGMATARGAVIGKAIDVNNPTINRVLENYTDLRVLEDGTTIRIEE